MSDQQFSQRDVPWLKIGTKVDEAVTSAEAIQLAGLDWDVAVRKDGFQTASGNWRVDPSKRKIVRVDTERPLGTVSSTYEMLQYREAFDFMDGINPEFVAAGGLNDGKQAFIVVRAPQHAKLETLAGEDPHDFYVVLRSSHDGSKGIEINLMPLRDKCMNMMTGWIPLNHVEQRWSIRHTKNMRQKMIQAQDVVTGADRFAQAYNETAERLAAVDMTVDEVRKLLEDTAPRHLKNRNKTYIDPIMDVYEHSAHNGFQGTAWGALNAVSEYHEHFRGGENRAPETRWVQGLNGSTSVAIERTLRALTH